METTFRSKEEQEQLRSYRTYEEWKLIDKLLSQRSKYRSYRTYEEWKPGLSSSLAMTSTGSYRTYEEWKPDKKHLDRSDS